MICPIPRRLRTHPTSITSTYPGVVHPGVQRAEPADGIHAIAEPAAGGEGPAKVASTSIGLDAHQRSVVA